MNPGPSDPAESRHPPEAAAFHAVSRPSRRTPLAIASLSLAILVLALLTRQPDPAASEPATGSSALPQAGAIVSLPGPVDAPPPSPTPAPPDLDPAATPRPTPITTPAEPGPTQLGPVGQGSPRAQVVLGESWMRASDGTVAKAGGGSPSGITIGAWSLQRAHVFPCRWSSGVFADVRLMQTAQSQAQVLASWWGQDPGMPPDSNAPIAPIATRPRQATLAGYPAWSLEILIPTDFETAACDGGQMIFWETASGDVRFGLGPGELIRVWVVDLDGRPIVIEGSTFLTGPPGDAAELDAILDSLVIVPG